MSYRANAESWRRRAERAEESNERLYDKVIDALHRMNDEVKKLRSERDEARAWVDMFEWAQMLTNQECSQGKHPDWFVDSEHNHLCPWCEIERLRELAEKSDHALAVVADVARTRETQRDEARAELNKLRDNIRLIVNDPDVVSAIEYGVVSDGLGGGYGLSTTEALGYADDALSDVRSLVNPETTDDVEENER